MPPSGPRTNRSLPASLALSMALLAGCGPELTGVTTTAGDPQLGTAMEAVSANNGMSQNGMSQNGMSQNGMSQNGMSQNGFGTTSFKNWFNTNPVLSDVVMQYLAKCAAAAGSSYSWTNPSTGKVHTWSGQLGLTPAFAAGTKPTTTEQQLLTACLAAHVNKYGIQVPIAIEGRKATGTQLPIGAGELTTYSVREACWFGNLFTGEGVFGGPDHSSWNAKTSTARACVFDTDYKDSSSQCAPIFQIGFCSSNCAKDPTNTFYETCTYNGKTYKALATRIRPAEVYTCGDGVCQMTEKCGSGANWDSCENDCGQCP